jgi:hypothetical protein
VIATLAVLAIAAVAGGVMYKNRATIEADLKAKFSTKLEAAVAVVKADAVKLEASAKAEVVKAVDFVVAEIKAKL